MGNKDTTGFEDIMIDYVRKWRRLSISIPLVDGSWLKAMMIKKGIVDEGVINHKTVSKQESEKLINRFKEFNEERIRLKDDWTLDMAKERMRQKDSFDKNFSKNRKREIENDDFDPMGNPLDQLSCLIYDEDYCENEFVEQKYDASRLPTFYDMDKLCPELKKNFFGNINAHKNKAKHQNYTSLWDLAVNIAYNEMKASKLLRRIKSLEEWKEKVKDQSSLEYSACHTINMSLNESGVIIKNLLNEMGIEFSGEFWKNIDRNDMEPMSETVQDIYYLLELIIKYKKNNQRKWKEYDNESSFGRSFLKDGKGGLAFYIKNNLQDKCGWNKCIDQEYSIVGLLSSLFVIPKMLESELYWNSVDLEKGSDIKFEFVVKKILLEDFQSKPILKKRLRYIESFEETDYSILDELYWFISIRQLKDFFVVDGKESQSIWSEFTIDSIALLKIIENMDSSGKDIDTDSCIKIICAEYLLNRHYDKKKESLNTKIVRAQELYNSLYDFYQKGMNVFRNSEVYEWIFDKTKLLNMTKNGGRGISKIKNTYIKSVILITYIVMGKKELCLIALNAKTLEKKCSLVKFVNLYKEATNKNEFFKNPTAYFVWEFLNDRIEWGRDAKKINEFRQTIIVPYLLTYTGLRNNDSDENSFCFNEIIAELLPERNIDFLDIQIAHVQKSYEIVTG